MAYTTINKSTDYFDTKLHNGNATAKTLAYDFEVDMFWTKMRNDAYPHNLYDVVRGNNQRLRTNGNNADSVTGNTVSFGNSAGISLGTDSGNYGVNKTQTDGGSQATYAGWGWKAGGTGSSNTDGTITSTVSANTTAGFSIVKYSGNSGGNGYSATIGHGLGVAPSMVMVKCITNNDGWFIYHKGNTSAPETDFIRLDNTDGTADLVGMWYDTAPTSSVFTVGTDGGVNQVGRDYIAYCFAPKTGYSKMGSYIGNGDVDGTFVYTGFKPKFILTKMTSASGNGWGVFDDKRLGYNPWNGFFQAQLSSAETSIDRLDILSNGFKPRYDWNFINQSGQSYIYLAFGQSLVGTNNVPCTAR